MTSMRRGVNLPRLGGYNQRVVLDSIRRCPDGLSRVELAHTTGLSPQTISNVTRRLLDAGLVREAGVQVLGPGKPRTLLVPDGQGMFAVGVHVDPAMIHGVVLDLLGRPRADFTTASPQSFGPDEATVEIARLVRAVLRDASVPADRVGGIGLAVPGPLRDGVIVDPPLLPSWRGVDLRADLAARLRGPVFIEKDVVASARGEMWLRSGQVTDSFGYLYLGSGVGFGAVLRGEVFRGSSGNFGEMGHLRVRNDGEPCPCCGARGTIGLECRPSAVLAGLAAAGLWNEPAPTNATDADDQFRRACAVAARDDSAQQVFAELGKALGAGCALLSDVFDLGEVVLGGPYWPLIEPLTLGAVHRGLGAHSVLRSARTVQLTVARAPHRAESVGAAAVVFDRVLSANPRQLVDPAGSASPLQL